MAEEAPRPFRVMPAVGPDNEHFWLGGAEGRLQFLRCGACGWWIHPPQPRCPACLSTAVEVEAVSGLGVVHTYTVNHQPWYPHLDPPYVIAVVALDEQDGLRLTTNIVGCGPDEVHIGQRVRVTFERYDEVWLPFFEPVGGSPS